MVDAVTPGVGAPDGLNGLSEQAEFDQAFEQIILQAGIMSATNMLISPVGAFAQLKEDLAEE